MSSVETDRGAVRGQHQPPIRSGRAEPEEVIPEEVIAVWVYCQLTGTRGGGIFDRGNMNMVVCQHP